MTEIEQLWDNIVKHHIATENELQRVTNAGGKTLAVLNCVVMLRTKYRSWQELEDAEKLLDNP